jgi:hypothetical protein
VITIDYVDLGQKKKKKKNTSATFELGGAKNPIAPMPITMRETRKCTRCEVIGLRQRLQEEKNDFIWTVVVAYACRLLVVSFVLVRHTHRRINSPSARV